MDSFVNFVSLQALQMSIYYHPGYTLFFLFFSLIPSSFITFV